MSKYEELRLRLNFNMEDSDQVKLYEWLKQYSSAYERNRALMGTLLRALSENVSTEGVSIPDSFLNSMSNMLDEKIAQLKKELCDRTVSSNEVANSGSGNEEARDNKNENNRKDSEVENEELDEIPEEFTNYLREAGFM